MLKYQTGSMKQHPRHAPFFFPEFVLFVAAMRPVADDGVADMGEVLAQLVEAAGFRSQFDKGVTGGGMFAEGDINFSLFYGFKKSDGRLGSPFFIFQIIINHAFGRRKTAHDGLVTLFGFPFRKQQLELAIDFWLQSKKQNAARFPIQSMGRKNSLANLVAEHLQGKLCGIFGDRRAVYQEAGRFVDGNEVLILIDYFEFIHRQKKYPPFSLYLSNNYPLVKPCKC